MRVTVILTQEEGEAFQLYCERYGFKKSTLISHLIREHIKNSEFTDRREIFGKSNPEQAEK